MARILCLCPSHRDRRELPRFAGGHELLFHDYASLELEELTVPGAPRERIRDVAGEIDRILDVCSSRRVDAVLSTDDYPGAALASVIAHEVGLPGPTPRASLVCQHKYLARQAQAAVLPGCAPTFQLLDVRGEDGLRVPEFPVFVKPVKSFFSVGAGVVASQAQLERKVRRWRGMEAFFGPFAALLERYAGHSMGSRFLLAEGCLQGVQSTLECYVRAGDLHPLGVVDSLFHPGTLAFDRFEYPSRLPIEVQERMAAAGAVVLRAIGFDQGLANIEFIYDAAADRLAIVEINPRMSSQFADLFEKVDGTNTYELLLDLALDRPPRPRRRGGAHAFAASCVMRRFDDGVVQRVPAMHEVRTLTREMPDARVEVLAEEGQRLSAQMQDDCSFRYGIVNLGGADRAAVLQSFARLRRRLPFRFAGERRPEPGGR